MPKRFAHDDDVDRLEKNRIDTRRIKEKDSNDLKVVESVFDKATVLTIDKLIRKGILKKLVGIVSTGKEANVYLAKNPEDVDLAVKIFRTHSEFRKYALPYIEGDYRFKLKRKDSRSVTYVWTLKEFKNLKLAEACGVRVPSPIAVRNNVLVMEFIGTDGIPAPRMKDIPPENPEKIFPLIIECISRLYHQAKLVHADLSEYNVLIHNDAPVLIDISQGVLLHHPHSKKFLLRDVNTIVTFFNKLGVITPHSKEIFNKIIKET
ncbi:MAG: serine protein kinase RIO [Promethearchaeota archaeon]